MVLISNGRYRVRSVGSRADLAAVQRLRALAFGISHDAAPEPDEYDDRCATFMVINTENESLVCSFRLLLIRDRIALTRSYAAQFYTLSGLETFGGNMVEMGRFCLRPGCSDPDIVRCAWGTIAAFVDDHNVEMLFGCASFAGTEPIVHRDAFAMLKTHYLAPDRWLPRVKAPDVFHFGDQLRCRPDVKQAMKHMPPLLRSYLLMGGWVSDHAVIDWQMKTLHVFTGLEVARIPVARKKLLRGVAGRSKMPPAEVFVKR